MIKEKIIEFCNELGLDTIGFIECREFSELKSFYQSRKDNNLENEFEEKDINKRINPKEYMSEGKTIISIGFPYLWYKENESNGFSKYTKGLDYHRVVKWYLEQICVFIKELGGKAIYFVDSNSLPERYIAYLAGVGHIGKNNMIITKKYGSYVFLGEIITDLYMETSDMGSFEKINDYEICGHCERCLEGCPTKAITRIKRNPNICSSYITQKKEITNIEIKLLKDKIFGCDQCQDCCPLNREVKFSGIEGFKPLGFMEEYNSNIYAQMDNKFFKDKISKTSCGWRGKNVIKRNAIIKLHNEDCDIKKYIGQSEYLNKYIVSLTENKK